MKFTEPAYEQVGILLGDKLREGVGGDRNDHPYLSQRRLQNEWCYSNIWSLGFSLMSRRCLNHA